MFDEKELRLARGVFLRNGANRVYPSPIPSPSLSSNQQIVNIPVNHQNLDRLASVTQDQSWAQNLTEQRTFENTDLSAYQQSQVAVKTRPRYKIQQIRF